MASNPSIFPQIGMEAMNTGYFMAGNSNSIIGSSGMMSGDVTPFHPSTLLEYGSSLGLASLGGVTVAEVGEQFAANNVTLASFADHLSATRPHQDEHLGPPDEMDCEFNAGGGENCGAASLLRCIGGQSGGTAAWSQYGSWSSVSDRSRTTVVSVYDEPYCLAGFPDAAGFHFPLTSCGRGGPSAPATSELSLTLCSKPSASVLHATTDQCSSVASRSALTELPQATAHSTPAHFAVVVARSRYAAAAQEVLNDVLGRLIDGVADVADSAIDSGGARPSSWSIDASSSVVSSNRLVVGSSEDAGARWGEAPRGRSDLLNMLQMLDDKYNQCLDEIQSTVAKFNGLVAGGRGGVGNASSICAPFAHRAVSAMYRGLKRRIAGEIMAASASRPSRFGESSSATSAGCDVERSWESVIIQKHWAAQKAREQHKCWRPQRGLPERSVAVLKAWMFEHFLKPYPDDHEKDMLAARSGLTRSQVSNWFINARVRIWKPMIEEMYQDLKRASAGDHGMEMGMEPLQNVSRAVCCQLEDGRKIAQLQ